MKKILILFLLLSACSNRINYYHGFIYSNKNKPLKGFKVASQFDIDINSVTDENGYFKITDKKAIGGNLIIFHKNKPIDTIVTVWSQHGEKLMYSFTNLKKDTIRLRKSILTLSNDF